MSQTDSHPNRTQTEASQNSHDHDHGHAHGHGSEHDLAFVSNDWRQEQYMRLSHAVEQLFEDIPLINPTIETFKPFGLAAVIGMFAVMLATNHAPALLGFGWAVFLWSMIGALVLVVVAPSEHVGGPLRWLVDVAQFHTSPKRLEATADDEQRRTQTATDIKQFIGYLGALKRRDNTLYGLVEVQGRDLSMASGTQRLGACRDFKNFAMSVDSGFEVYSPGRVIEPREILADYYGRENDPDVQQNPVLRHMLTVYQHDMREAFRRRGTAVRSYYVGTSVTEHEAAVENREGYDRLSNVPILGWFARATNSLFGDDVPEEYREIDQGKILKRRRQSIETELNAMSDTSASKTSAHELAGLHEEFWTGLKADFERADSEDFVGGTTGPIVDVHESAENESAADTGGH